MSNILHITASIRGDESISRSLSTQLAEGLAEKTGAQITARDLSRGDIPYIDAARFAANLTPKADRTPEQQDLAALADGLITELQAADILVMGIPVYNFSMPATLKSWVDMVARAGTTFKYTENGPVGLLENKTAYITVASGGTPVGSPIDHLTPWLKQVLGFVGIEVADIIAADGIMGQDGEAKIKAAHEQVAKLIAR